MCLKILSHGYKLILFLNLFGSFIQTPHLRVVVTGFRIPTFKPRTESDGNLAIHRHDLTNENTLNSLSRLSLKKSAGKPSPDKESLDTISFAPYCGIRPISPPSKARIVGGEEAWLGQFPWQMQLLVKPSNKETFRFQCGGTLVANNLIITAAHCVTTTDTESYSIVAGKQKQDPSYKSCNEHHYRVKKIVVHPSYNRRNLQNDIALVWVESKYNQSVHFTDYIQPACLPNQNSDPSTIYKIGQHGTVSGWGLLNEKHKEGSATLQHVSVPIADNVQCKKAYSRLVEMNTDVQFCAGNNRGQDACAGDSGGPFVRKINGKYVLAGVVSFGKGCARQQYPGVYTKVHSYLPWILKEVDKMKPKVQKGSCKESDKNETTTITQQKPVATSPSSGSTSSTVSSSTTEPISSNGGSSDSLTPTKPSQHECGDGEVCETGLTNVQENPNTKSTEPFCSGAFKYISCKRGKSLHIAEAFFGRDSVNTQCEKTKRDLTISGRGAAVVSADDCKLTEAKYIIMKRCQGRRSCWLYHGMFIRSAFDPCPGKTKYGLVKYSCK